ncbi:Polypyrimidine tract-binding protein-like 1, partial [Mucuna pruriens]
VVHLLNLPKEYSNEEFLDLCSPFEKVINHIEGVSTLTEMESKFTVPSKVVHFRNLPKECSDEELLDLCNPFGKVINHMCCVGPNKNQGLVEFENINQAISMVSYHASSSNPAQLRGRTIYVQHSDRPEIVVNKFAKGNTLLVTMEGVETGDVSIDVIHSVFSKFGFIHKISTFNKSAGFQALIQYDDIETASLAKNALNRKSIPRQSNRSRLRSDNGTEIVNLESSKLLKDNVQVQEVTPTQDVHVQVQVQEVTLIQDVQVQVQEVTKPTLVLEQVQMSESDVSISDNSIEEQVQLSKLEVSILDNSIEDVIDNIPIALRKRK